MTGKKIKTMKYGHKFWWNDKTTHKTRYTSLYFPFLLSLPPIVVIVVENKYRNTNAVQILC